ncbi:hypothetical protein H5410_014637 [Solanum commersonii]|uniref:Uncharacterized protein n=1 Tax=Solanum commersonii TaxID=4109 RepID=A0A9J5ZRF2_SOLCO|nr:hypothetical protein H5410_014637 [Solanum commersonii]
MKAENWFPTKHSRPDILSNCACCKKCRKARLKREARQGEAPALLFREASVTALVAALKS